MNFFSRIFGTKSGRDIKKLMPVAKRINELEPRFAALSDEALRGQTAEFRSRLAERVDARRVDEIQAGLDGLEARFDQPDADLEAIRAERTSLREALEAAEKDLADHRAQALQELLPEAFAAVREAARRVVRMRHFDVQLLGGMVLHQGRIAEMKTGEGKTLVATLPAYLNALTGLGVHVVTVNDYLARRDSEWMGRVYEALGLTVGVIQHDMDDAERQRAYAADITYGTNNEFGFDYLRDNMKFRLEDCVQRGHHFAIVDEVDSILIDEARTPLIISGPSELSTEIYYRVDKVIPRLRREVDYLVDEKANTVTLTEEGIARAEKLLGVENLYDPGQIDNLHHLNQSLRAHNLFKRDTHYMVKDGQVVIVDEFTGRLMPGRRWSDGLHQAVEAKEGVKIERENQTLATITFQNYFRMYKKLAGMTGTAITEAEEFFKIYKLEVTEVPTNQPMIRLDHPDLVYRTQREKFDAIVEEIAECHLQGQPVLVGTVSIEKSEHISRLLKRKGVPHNVLNAKYHDREAAYVAQAGRKGAITIATNMAGRGTDILLGGNPEFMAREECESRRQSWLDLPPAEFGDLVEQKRALVATEHDEVVALGGLHIIGTERHEARRIDNQLRGRAGRQGDPGSSRFYLSLEDDLMRIYGGERISNFMRTMGMDEGVPIESRMISRQIERSQKQVEAHNFQIRKHLLKYDDVMNKQRQAIYAMRRDLLEGKDQREYLAELAGDLLKAVLDEATPADRPPEDWDRAALTARLQHLFGPEIDPGDLEQPREGRHEAIWEQVQEVVRSKEARIGRENMRSMERFFILHVVDGLWKDHLLALDHLKEGIGLRGYGQRDPLVEYKKESFDLFHDLLDRIEEEIVRRVWLTNVDVVREGDRDLAEEHRRRQAARPLDFSAGQEAGAERTPAKPKTVRKAAKVGRNDPCPCNSGKKFKQCCGRG